ncbi:MAG TPA: protein translocase subunit SecD, partial [Dermatophilaceae bacterium]|nr:protein translocase subunit SecD [Dermatophilaceae bacterium]
VASSVSAYHPWRVLGPMLLVLVGLMAWTFWPSLTSTPQLGLDLQGGTQVTLLPTTAPGTDGTITDEQLDQAVGIIRQRVDGLGVAESEVTVQGSGENAAIIVSVPGSVAQDRLVELVGRTAQLAFRQVEAITNPEGVDPSAEPSEEPEPSATPTQASPTPTDGSSPSPSPSASDEPSPSASPSDEASASPSASPTVTQPEVPVQAAANDAEFQERALRLDCTFPENRSGTPDDQALWLATCDREGAAKYLLQPAFIKGTQVTNAQAQLDPATSKWSVSLTFDSAGAKALSEISSDIYDNTPPQNQFAIVLDGVVFSAPSFLEPIPGGSAQITGEFTIDEANDLANVLKFGSLPISLEVGEITSITPTVGDAYLKAGLLAGAIGLALVALYLLFYYRALGLVAAASLVVAGIITYCLFVIFGRTLGFTLTLAGIAGAIVAIGITADSFIVYFERLRDEVREGRTLRVAAETGWIRARRTLLAADFVSLLGAVVLYVLSIGSVRGFAFALGLTTVVDVVVAFTFTRPVVAILAATKFFQSGHPLSGVDPRRLGIPETPARSTTAAGRR